MVRFRVFKRYYFGLMVRVETLQCNVFVAISGVASIDTARKTLRCNVSTGYTAIHSAGS